ncbi:hypothetical protein SERLA73DRAFT_60342 [Serpula lacrymans var. lacrymans S7.3]|uniref:DUF1776-domain-containing protein n=2 Tax=Serpula lacrymans var. lacrymans TaxID=341189 RepID=F8Q7M5_SERL3|nr:uncharacterized protein SERLADRAFT_351552 [Serpula lacrymans var. lacrymans S7.9]EGN95563.1 hypothetical protein SERLA73DRAFT_60342 [Serpula lacrymans var. lacrymans S7.3]EGO21091.1 hypothetical protein SERLADRAFT_351552 [Serpula lacrymans var. lacrymans S7.9]
MVPIVDEVEDFLQSLEHYLHSVFPDPSPLLPNIREAVNRLWIDLARFGPPGIQNFPDIHMPSLGAFEVPPPPPPPPPKSLLDKTGDWAASHPWLSSGLIATALGAGLLVGYSKVYIKYANMRHARFAATSIDRRQVVVVLGGDHPLGLPLIMDLEQKGYIVIVSVSNPDVVDEIESKGHGYVRALVLDPYEPGTIPIFLRSLASSLSRRFPITAAGDPHAPSTSHPLLHSVVSLLTLPTPSIHTNPAPLEQLSLRSTYLPHLFATHVAPLQAIQAILPLLRADASRPHATIDRKSVIICLPAADARVGVPFSSVRAMSAAATLRAAEVLRRESALALSASARAIRIVTVDVGTVGPSPSAQQQPHRPLHAMSGWTPSEKTTYGPAFSALLAEGAYGVPRCPTETSVFVDAIIRVVGIDNRREGRSPVIALGLGIVDKIRDWIRGDRFSVGAGAGTYAFASHFPPAILDALLNIPNLLIGLRNRLLPVPPPLVQPYAPPERPSSSALIASTVIPANIPIQAEVLQAKTAPPPIVSTPVAVASEPEHEEVVHNFSETSSEADVESSAGDVESSWVSLGPRPGQSVASLE